MLALPPPASGAFDPAYGSGGYTYLPWSDSNFEDLAVYESGPNAGKTVAVGGAGDQVQPAIIARYNRDGSPDGSFGRGGFIAHHHPGSEFSGGRYADEFVAVAIDPDGKLLVTGNAHLVGGYVARLNADGTLDTNVDATPLEAFGPDGSGYLLLSDATPGPLTLPPGGSDDGIFLAARTNTSPAATRVYRLTGPGSIAWSQDITLGPDAGTLDSSRGSAPRRLLLEPDLDVVVAGAYLDASRAAWGVARLTADGAVDTAFGQDGGALFLEGDRSSFRTVNGLALDSSGRIVLGGDLSFGSVSTINDHPGVLIRIGPDGRLDQDFGFAASEETSPAGISDLVVDGAGRAIASGYVRVPRETDYRYDPAVSRYDAAGHLDESFGVCGTASGQVALPTTGNPITGVTRAVALDGQGIVVAGRNSTSFPQAFVARFLSDGGFEEGGSCEAADDGGGGVAGEVAASGRGITVHRVRVPKSLEKLLARGVRVRASCELDCRIVLEIRVSEAVAGRLGLADTLLGRATASADAGERRWVVAKLSGGARRALRFHSGGGRLKISVTGEAP